MNQFQKQQTGYWIVQFSLSVTSFPLIDRHPCSEKAAQAMQEQFIGILNLLSLPSHYLQALQHYNPGLHYNRPINVIQHT